MVESAHDAAQASVALRLVDAHSLDALLEEGVVREDDEFSLNGGRVPMRLEGLCEEPRRLALSAVLVLATDLPRAWVAQDGVCVELLVGIHLQHNIMMK